MDIKKILILLIVLVIYINYENYFKRDTSKLHRQIGALQANIMREEEIEKSSHTEESLLINYDEIVFSAKKYSYSKAMGEVQNQIADSAKNICKIKKINWAQVPSTKEWYDVLKMNISLSCTPKNLFILTNRLKDKDILYVVENFRIQKDRKESVLGISLQLVAFRTLQ